MEPIGYRHNQQVFEFWEKLWESCELEPERSGNLAKREKSDPIDWLDIKGLKEALGGRRNRNARRRLRRFLLALEDTKSNVAKSEAEADEYTDPYDRSA